MQFEQNVLAKNEQKCSWSSKSWYLSSENASLALLIIIILKHILQKKWNVVPAGGSKTEETVGAAVYWEDLNLIVSFRLPNEFSIFQADIKAIDIETASAPTNQTADKTIYIFEAVKLLSKRLT